MVVCFGFYAIVTDMLVAELIDKTRVLAWDAEKGTAYHCPGCKQEVVLKKGGRVIHHFAHKPPVSCSWAMGETVAHMNAKEAFYEEFKRQGFEADIEYPLASGRLRADVHIKARDGRSIVIEVQHSNLELSEIERRTNEYFKLGIIVVWVPLRSMKKFKAKPSGNPVSVDRFTPKPFERWLHGFYFGKIWYFDPDDATLWHGRFENHMIDVPYREWYASGGSQSSSGGYSRISKRWKKLMLRGPFKLDQVKFSIKKRDGAKVGTHNYPAGYLLDIEAV